MPLHRTVPRTDLWQHPKDLWPASAPNSAERLDQRPAVPTFYVYIMSNASRTLYTGVTNDLVRRVWEHKQKTGKSFAARHNATQLVWFEETINVAAAIEREKQIKSWVRAKKIALVAATNPTWRDLSADEGFSSRSGDGALAIASQCDFRV